MAKKTSKQSLRKKVSPPSRGDDWSTIGSVGLGEPVYSPVPSIDLAALSQVPTPQPLNPHQVPPGTGFGHAFAAAAQALAPPAPDTLAEFAPDTQSSYPVFNDVAVRHAQFKAMFPEMSDEQTFRMALNQASRMGVGNMPAHLAAPQVAAAPQSLPMFQGGVGGTVGIDNLQLPNAPLSGYRPPLDASPTPITVDPVRRPLTLDEQIATYGPGTIQASGFGGGTIGPISEADMAAIMARRQPAWNTGSPDTRDLSRLPLPPERVNPAAQALPPEELAALQQRFGHGMSIGLTGAPLNRETIYPDLLAAARAKLAGQDVTVPTVVGSNRYAGGSAQAQQMQKDSWQRARQARDDRAAQQAQRMAADPVTQYRAARAGNPAAANQVMLNSLGGANAPAALAMMLGPQGAAHVMAQQLDAQGRLAGANAEAGAMQAFMQQKKDEAIAAMAAQFMQADPSLTPEQARAKAASLYGVPAPQPPAPPAAPSGPGFLESLFSGWGWRVPYIPGIMGQPS